MNSYPKRRQWMLLLMFLRQFVIQIDFMPHCDNCPIALMEFFMWDLPDAVLVNSNVISDFWSNSKSNKEALAEFFWGLRLREVQHGKD